MKLWLRSAYARLLFHSGLHALVDRAMPRRFLILAGHCVSAPSNASLPKDMKIEGGKLERILSWFAARYEVTSVGAGLRRLREPGKKSLVALSMDDGYKDNRTHLLPLLARVGVPATVYLESAPLDLRRLNWSHCFFGVLDALGPAELVKRYAAASGDARAKAALEGLLAQGRASSYPIKRVLKYEADPVDRNRVLRELFSGIAADETRACDELYMTWDDARALRDGGVELGGHTVNHEILSRLEPAAALAEVRDGRESMRRALGFESASFAYPFGRRWDYDARSKEAGREAGFASAATTHAGTNDARTDPYELKRVMIDEDAELHLLVAEACGGFDLLRRVGLDLSE
jgi:peptidoglycan/xylan/chitin deacetylase (PgdA/CDA1 family)